VPGAGVAGAVVAADLVVGEVAVEVPEDQRCGDHDPGEHADLEQPGCEDVKDDDKEISYGACFAVQEEKADGQVKDGAKPAEGISYPDLVEKRADQRYVSIGWQPDP